MTDRRAMAASTSSDDDESSGAESWIEWFCKQEGNEFLCEIDQRYIDDNFNLYGLREVIGQSFKKCLDVILDRADSDEVLDETVQDLYGLIHARFILTKRGQEKMKRKFKNRDFGVCPIQSCLQNPVLPVGLRDNIDFHPVMVYCSRCGNVMMPGARASLRFGDEHPLDGAYFGTTFAHLFLMQFPDLRGYPTNQPTKYIPKVFGFRVRIPNQELDNRMEVEDK
mmetsp:Transcript_5361/g.6255  ORF Transcript_5361/g.6255 Transcript_5361/m.6255 type:complete len:224 (-) Transcript_5361:64-735(-)|eukprot:CAMPEP_0184009958 /NCGR_PEP_ID=MMETSP0954-20121128/2920_1 /TAXON_ID=627963 /ORGANISM="Aplanochytrium sp, Strain PBS07" /LENGTH=223 /DNA_ID=CAMNT_0026289441 /DNA_START=376 /DNA_END=1047 /DNA_ORIENTATION=-